MPKSAGSKLQPVHIANPRPVKVERVKLTGKQDGPHHRGLPSTPSNKFAAEAVRIAGSPGGIYPRQH